jgi:hypothetical protein
VDLCAQRIPRDLISFSVSWCGFRCVSFDLWLLFLAIVAALVRWSFKVLARTTTSHLSTTTSSTTTSFARLR